MTDHPTPGSPLSADDVGCETLGPAASFWANVERPTDRRAEAEAGKTSSVARPVEGATATSASGSVRADKDAPTPPSAGPDAGLETVAWLTEPEHGGPRRVRLHRPHPSHDARLNPQPLVTRQSAAAALEAAAKREGELREALVAADKLAHTILEEWENGAYVRRLAREIRALSAIPAPGRSE